MKKYLDVRECTHISIYDIEGRIVDIINMLQKYVFDHGENTVIHIIENSYTNLPEIEICWFRKETDKEREKRLKRQRKEREREKKRKEEEKKRLRKEYEKLKKMFEDES